MKNRNDPEVKLKVRLKRVEEKWNLFNRESETSDDDSGEEEEEKGDPEGRSPRERHG